MSACWTLMSQSRLGLSASLRCITSLSSLSEAKYSPCSALQTTGRGGDSGLSSILMLSNCVCGVRCPWLEANASAWAREKRMIEQKMIFEIVECIVN